MFFQKKNEIHHQKKVLICSNYAWTIYNFRKPLIDELVKNNYSIYLLSQFDGYETRIDSRISGIYHLSISRKGINVFKDLYTYFHILFQFIIIKPNYILLFTIKPVIYGSMVAKILRIPSIPMITGLGTTFIKKNWITHLVKKLYKIALKNQKIVFFQNKEDMDLFIDQNLIKQKQGELVPGSGIDTSKFMYQEKAPSERITFLLVARMIRDKGVVEFVEAASLAKAKNYNVKFKLLGPVGVQNRTAISEKTIKKWNDDDIIEYIGETDHVIKHISEADCIVLPSYREGTSRVLLEAASIGRPIITTNVPGCKEIVDNEINGLICKVRDSQDLFSKIERMISLNHHERVQMGLMGRKKVKNEFDSTIVNEIYLRSLKRIKL
jgi:glycosyltransferase involved in cell wall biosynthesis